MTPNRIGEPIPSFLFSADRHTGHDRFDAWQHEVAQLFDVAPVADMPSFEGIIDGYMLDGMLVARNQFSEQKYSRDRRLVARTGLDAYLVQLYTDGGFDGYADNAEMSVRAGDVCVFDLTDTLATQAMQSSTVSLVIPKLLVDRHWNARAPVNGLVIEGATALGQVMGAHLAALSSAMPDVTVSEAPVIAAMTARLIADCLAHCTSGGGLSARPVTTGPARTRHRLYSWKPGIAGPVARYDLQGVECLTSAPLSRVQRQGAGSCAAFWNSGCAWPSTSCPIR